MIIYQQDFITPFERKVLHYLQKKLSDSQYEVFIGFEYGFFKGMNLYYGNEEVYFKAKEVYDRLKQEKILIRLFTNLPCDYDLIIFLGYTNQFTERIRIIKKMSKIVKALSSL